MAQQKEAITPYNVFNIEPTASDGPVNVRVVVKLATVGMQAAENAGFYTLSADPTEHGASSSAEPGTELRPVIVNGLEIIPTRSHREGRSIYCL